jgi:hypothetical protein
MLMPTPFTRCIDLQDGRVGNQVNAIISPIRITAHDDCIGATLDLLIGLDGAKPEVGPDCDIVPQNLVPSLYTAVMSRTYL